MKTGRTIGTSQEPWEVVLYSVCVCVCVYVTYSMMCIARIIFQWQVTPEAAGGSSEEAQLERWITQTMSGLQENIGRRIKEEMEPEQEQCNF